MYQRERLFSRLGHFAYQSFVEATKLCRTFRHEYVELEHWLKVLVDKERGDLPLIWRTTRSIFSASAMRWIAFSIPCQTGRMRWWICRRSWKRWWKEGC